MPWTRDPSVPFPSVWGRHRGTKALPDGSVPEFVIQDVTDDMHDAILEHMQTEFLPDEPLCSTAGVLEQPDSLTELLAIWRDMLKKRVSIVALVDGQIAGCNVMSVEMKGEHKDFQLSGKATKLVLHYVTLIEEMTDPFERFGVDRYLSALGLSVGRGWRGQGLGAALLAARTAVGRSVGLPLTVTVFTAVASQILAERVGFVLLAHVSYKDVTGEDGKPLLNVTKAPGMKRMAMEIK